MQTSDLIATIYAATLSPYRFHETAAEMEAAVIALVRETTGIADFGEVLPEGRGWQLDPAIRETLVRHVDMALAIQARLDTESESRDSRIAAMLDITPNPAVVFDLKDRIVRANRMATKRYPAGVHRLADMIADSQHLDQVRTAAAAMRPGAEFVALPLQVDAARHQSTCILMKRIAPGGANGEPALFLLTIVDFGFSDEIAEAFRATYDLTDAEAAVALLLAGGISPAEIAAQRYVSVDTVRSQIKAVKQKTATRDIPDLVRLLCGFSTGILVPQTIDAADPAPLAVVAGDVRTMRLNDGRTLEYIVQGAPQGDPVILFHNMPYGQFLPAAAVRHAARLGLTIYAPVRPGCRGSDPLPGLRGSGWLDAVCRDTVELLDRLGIDDARLLGNVAGATFAVRFATLYPQRVTGIVMVSRAPIWRKAWLGQLTTHHRLLSILLWTMPKLADIFVSAIVS